MACFAFQGKAATRQCLNLEGVALHLAANLWFYLEDLNIYKALNFMATNFFFSYQFSVQWLLLVSWTSKPHTSSSTRITMMFRRALWWNPSFLLRRFGHIYLWFKFKLSLCFLVMILVCWVSIYTYLPEQLFYFFGLCAVMITSILVILLMSRILQWKQKLLIQFLSWKRFNVSRRTGNGLYLSSTADSLLDILAWKSWFHIQQDYNARKSSNKREKNSSSNLHFEKSVALTKNSS